MPKVVAFKQLPVEVANLFPDGTQDRSTYSDIEEALDRADAPATDANGKWLSLPARVAALAAERDTLKR